MDETTNTRTPVSFRVKVALALVAALFLYKMGFQGIGILTAFTAVVLIVYTVSTRKGRQTQAD